MKDFFEILGGFIAGAAVTLLYAQKLISKAKSEAAALAKKLAGG